MSRGGVASTMQMTGLRSATGVGVETEELSTAATEAEAGAAVSKSDDGKSDLPYGGDVHPLSCPLLLRLCPAFGACAPSSLYMRAHGSSVRMIIVSRLLTENSCARSLVWTRR